MQKKIILNKLPIGEKGRVVEIMAKGNKRRRLFDLGIMKNTFIKPLHISPAGDPIAYQIRGAVIALRSEEANKVLVEKQRR